MEIVRPLSVIFLAAAATPPEDDWPFWKRALAASLLIVYAIIMNLIF